MQIQSISNSNNPAFQGWKVNGDKILKAGQGELRNYAEHFHKLKKEELMEIATVNDFFGLKMKSESENAFVKLQGAVREVLTNVWDWKDRISNIEEREASGKKLTESQEESLRTLRGWVNEVEQKANNCKNVYYETEYVSAQDSSDPYDGLDPVTLRGTHYD